VLEKKIGKRFLFQKSFGFFILGYFLSAIGSQIQNTGQIWLVYKLTDSPFHLGLFSFLTSFFSLIFVTLGGILADLFERKILLILINLFSFFFSLILGILVYLNKIDFWSITFLVFLYNCLLNSEIPLRQVFVSELLPLSLITQGVAFQSLAFNFARLAGPFLSGIILTYSYVYNCFYLNALSFLIFTVFIFFVNPEFKKINLSHYDKLGKNIKLTFSLIKKRKISKIILSVVNYTFFGNSIVILFPYITNKIYQKDPKDFAFLLTALGVGAILGAGWIILNKIKNEISHLRKATFLLALGILGLSFCRMWDFANFFAFLIGFSLSNFFPVANGFLQKSVSNEFRGKIISIFTFSYLGTFPLGDLVISYLIEVVNFNCVIILYVLLLLVINIALLKDNS
jgi:MFS family permease